MKKTTPQINILDVTVRDGSYVHKFSFTPKQVSEIVGRLSTAGVEYIEASHGLGIGITKMGLPSGATDLQYAEAAAAAKGKAKVGAIGHHKWTTLDELKELSQYLDFFRIVSNANEPEPLKPFIERCHNLDLKIMIQFSRSSQVPKEVVADSVKKVASWGADVVYIVDTTGYFIPEEVKSYIKHVKDVTDVTLGFHAHNSLNLALANSIEAIRAGCEFIDASLLGIGRDSGNVPLASLVSIMERHKMPCKISIKELLLAGEELIKPILEDVPLPPWYAQYLAHKKRDFWPYSVLKFIAGKCGKSMEELLDVYTELPDVVEIEKEDLEELVRRLGGDPKEVLKPSMPIDDMF
jgi:4-hydroxy 2-oxovalerate aldolase